MKYLLELLSLMISIKTMALLLLVLLSLFASPATADDSLYHLCGTSAENVTSNSTYSSNLNLLLSTLSSNASVKGFASCTTGRVPDRVYGIAFCRGDTDIANCSSCISTAMSDIQKLCENNMEGAIWYDYCQVVYSNQDVVHEPDITNNNLVDLLNDNNVSTNQLLRFETLTIALMENVSDLAVKNTSRFFATGEAALTATDIIYGQMQCAMDLSVGECRSCLLALVATINLDVQKRSRGRRAMGLWCNMRYEFYKFYNGKSTLQLSSDQPPSSPSPTNVATHPLADLSHGGIALEVEFDPPRQKKVEIALQ